MIEEENKSAKKTFVIFLIISVCIHGLLFYFIPKLPKPPTPKSQKPISVKLIEEQPVKGKHKAPKKASVLGKENITVKKEVRPENKPKIEGSKRVAKRLPPPVPPAPPKVATPPQPTTPKKSVKVVPPPPKATSKKRPSGTQVSKSTRGVKTASHPTKRASRPQEKILATRRKNSFNVAEARPKKRILPTPAAPRKKVPSAKTLRHPARPGKKQLSAPAKGLIHPSIPRKALPLPPPKSLFPSSKTLSQIERKYSQSFPSNIPKGDVISLNTKSYKYISYFTHIKRKIELVWEYPRAAAEMGEEGSLILRFTILKDGRLAGVWLIQSSGYRLLDQEAIRAVREAAPFNPIPDRLKKDHLNIQARFTYTLGFKFVY